MRTSILILPSRIQPRQRHGYLPSPWSRTGVGESIVNSSMSGAFSCSELRISSNVTIWPVFDGLTGTVGSNRKTLVSKNLQPIPSLLQSLRIRNLLPLAPL